MYAASSQPACFPLLRAPQGASSHFPDGHLACILGVKVQIQSLNGEHLHIREFHRVKVGDIATGISSQVRGRYTLRGRGRLLNEQKWPVGNSWPWMSPRVSGQGRQWCLRGCQDPYLDQVKGRWCPHALLAWREVAPGAGGEETGSFILLGSF